MRITPLYAAGLPRADLLGLATATPAWHCGVRMSATADPSVTDAHAQKPSYASAAPERCP